MSKNMIMCPKCHKQRTRNIGECPWCKAREEKEKSIEARNDSGSEDTSVGSYEEGTSYTVTTDSGKTFLLELSPEWDIQNKGKIISPLQEEQMYKLLADVDTLRRCAPSIYGIIKNMAKEEHILVAKLDEYTKELIDKGELWFSVDKKGNLLPTIRNKQHIVKQVRLEERVLQSTGHNPQLVTDIYTQLILSKILGEVNTVKGYVESIKADLQDDRLAKADSAISKFKQALAVSGPRRESLMQLAAFSATEAKSVLMRNLHSRMEYVTANVHQSAFGRFFDSEGDSQLEQNANDVMNDLALIVQMVDIECTVHRYFGDDQAIKVCLEEYLDFIDANKLNEVDTLLKVTECLSYSGERFVNGFVHLTKNINEYQKGNLITQKETGLSLVSSPIKVQSAKRCEECKVALPSDCGSNKCEYCIRTSNKKIKKKAKTIVEAGKVIGGIVTVIGAGKSFFDNNKS